MKEKKTRPTFKNVDREYSRRIKELRLEKNISFEELSIRTEISVKRLKSIEDGTAKQMMMEQTIIIIVALGVEISDFYKTDFFRTKLTPDDPNDEL